RYLDWLYVIVHKKRTNIFEHQADSTTRLAEANKQNHGTNTMISKICFKIFVAVNIVCSIQFISTRNYIAHGLLVAVRSSHFSAKTKDSQIVLKLWTSSPEADENETFASNKVEQNKAASPLRRSAFLASVSSAPLFFSKVEESIAKPDETLAKEHNACAQLTIPLTYVPKLSAYTISYSVGKSKFGAIIDTGSPFLVVPQTSCKPDYPWGCYRPEESRPALGLSPTKERFDGNEGWVEWREGSFSFILDDLNDMSGIPDGRISNFDTTTLTSDTSISSTTIAAATASSFLFPKSSSMTFGVISESLMDGPGGIFLGLVKNTDDWIRPSFLKQSDVTAFSVDLRNRKGMPKTLTLYGGVTTANNSDTAGIAESRNRISSLPLFGLKQNKPLLLDDSPVFNNLLKNRDAIPLVRDLNKKYGDPTIHYVGMASSITVNGVNLATTSKRSRKLYVIFDTGCSGMSICPDLFDERYDMARSRREKSLWGKVDVELNTLSGQKVTMSANRPITTPLGSDQPWGKKLNGHLIILGLAFLEGKKMTVNIDGDKIWFEE
ncbi:hypothetical protein ACHAXS_002452, partial [Conticribra weissflogii]